MSLTKEQLELRKTGIGSSEAPVILGLSPYAAPIDVWRAKVEGRSLEETQPMKRGRLLEPAVCAWYAEDTGAQLREVGTLRHPSSSVLMATPDRIATLPEGERVLEVKTAHFRMLPQWGAPGTDEVPEAYLVQTAVEMACAKLEFADVAVLIAGDDFRIYHLKRDLELESMVLEAVERFWRDFVVTGKPPPPDASESYSEWLKAKHAKPVGPVKVADALAEVWAMDLRAAREAEAEAKKRKELAEQHLKAFIAEADGVEGQGWKISWKESKGRPSVDWESLCQELGIPKAAVEKHTRRNPFRMFRPTFQGEKSHE